MISAKQVLFIGGFGVLGVLSRLGIDLMARAWIPVGTWVVNILGCALAGFLFTLGEKEIISQSLQVALLVGFCGGFTTFSAYALQSFQLLEKGQFFLSMLYFTLSPLSGFLAAALGVFLTRKLLI